MMILLLKKYDVYAEKYNLEREFQQNYIISNEDFSFNFNDKGSNFSTQKLWTKHKSKF